MSTTLAPPKPTTTSLKPKPPLRPLTLPAKPGPIIHTPKTFTIKAWTNAGEGEKTLIYGKSGMGKTTLAAMAPNPIFIGLDDGARKILNPKTHEPVNAVMGVESFQDVRDVLKQTDLFPTGSTIVIDTLTKADNIGEQYTFAHIKDDKGQSVKSLEEYGFGKGYRYNLETMRLLISDLEPHVRRGVNVVLLCQQSNIRVANPEGLDYIQEAPKLNHQNHASTVGEFVEWSDNVVRIAYENLIVTKESKMATKGKVTGSNARIINTVGDLHFLAKNRSNGKLPPVVAFNTPDDDSLWQFIHGETA